MTMKILLVNNDKRWGGGQEHLKDLAQQLTRSECFPHIFCRSGSPSDEYFSSKGYPVYAMHRNPAGILKAIMLMTRILMREQFDIVLVTREHDLSSTALAWMLSFPFRKKGKLVICYHTATVRKQLFLGVADAVACVSTYIRDKLLEGNSLCAQSVKILPNGIPVRGDIPAEKFSVERQRRYFKGAGYPLIGMVGSFFKNQEEFLGIIPMLKQEFPGIKVALVGDDSDAGLTRPILARIRELGLDDSVIITGKVAHERLGDIFFDFDLSVSTFRNEGFGLVHLESLFAGTPVVAFNAGGQVDIFTGDDAGILVNGDSAEFAATVAGLLKDHDKRFAMGKRGHELVKEKFSVEQMTETYRTFFLRLLMC